MLNSYSSTLTTKGQATIPVFFRKKWGIKPGEKLIFAESDQGITIKTHSQLVNELYGSLKSKVKVKYSDKMADEAVGKMLGEEYIKTLPKKYRLKFK